MDRFSFFQPPRCFPSLTTLCLVLTKNSRAIKASQLFDFLGIKTDKYNNIIIEEIISGLKKDVYLVPVLYLDGAILNGKVLAH